MTKKEVENSEVIEEKLGGEVDDLPVSRETIKVNLAKEIVIAESNDLTRELYDKTRYGEPFDNKKFQYSLIEALYLIERGKFIVIDGKDKEIDFDGFVKKARKVEPNFWVRYVVFKDLRRRGYIVKTALKFGADFRVYDRGVKPGEDHARWVVFPVYEASGFTWFEMAAKNRVAHSTRKRLLLAVVDAESDVTYLELKWLRP
ncbi:tRNA-intron lyase [Candidatus Woesearchaeota archaeon]|nr:tRNA-intron lyase [Candidatus Woesearchaeota archaeon]